LAYSEGDSFRQSRKQKSSGDSKPDVDSPKAGVSVEAKKQSKGMSEIHRILGTTGRIDWKKMTRSQASKVLNENKGMSRAWYLKLREVEKHGPR
jgi:hypothetical protein